jgi:spermidine synthase
MAVIFLGHETTLGMALAAWLLWGGLGSFTHSKTSPTEDTPAFYIGWLALAGPVSVLLTRLANLLLPFGSLPGLFYTISVCFALLFLPCWAVGVVFRTGASLVQERGKAGDSSKIYFVESLGAFLAGVLLTALLIGRVRGFPVLVAGGTSLVVLSWLLLKPKRYGVQTAYLFLCVLLLVFFDPIDNWTRSVQFRNYRVLAQKESRYEHLAVCAFGNDNVLFQNGVVSVQFPDPSSQEEAVHWPLLAHEQPERMLALGASVFPAISEPFKHPSLKRLDIVEPDSDAAEILPPFLSPAQREVLASKRVRLHQDDPRTWIEANPGTYDVILHTFPEPMNASLNRLFTREFFRAARKALKPKGILALSLRSSENYLTPEIAYNNASVLKALEAAFGSVAIIPGDNMALLASEQPLDLGPQTLARRYHGREISNLVIVPPNFAHILKEGRRQILSAKLQELPSVETNTDMNPVSYFHTWRVWLSMFGSPSHFVGLGLAVLVFAFGLTRAWKLGKFEEMTRESVLILALGFASMCLEVVLLMAFQSLSGALYWQLGTLLGAFMAGLAAGSGLFSAGLFAIRRPGLMLGTAAILFACLCLGVSVGLSGAEMSSHGNEIWVFSLLLALNGFLVGAAFPIALAAEGQRPAGLYAADLWGAALGAFLTGAFLVPLLGMPGTLLAGAGFAALSVLAYLPVFKRPQP